MDQQNTNEVGTVNLNTNPLDHQNTQKTGDFPPSELPPLQGDVLGTAYQKFHPFKGMLLVLSIRVPPLQGDAFGTAHQVPPECHNTTGLEQQNMDGPTGQMCVMGV